MGFRELGIEAVGGGHGEKGRNNTCRGGEGVYKLTAGVLCFLLRFRDSRVNWTISVSLDGLSVFFFLFSFCKRAYYENHDIMVDVP